MQLPPINQVRAELYRRSFYEFVQYFWDTIIAEDPIWNWHIKYLCAEGDIFGYKKCLNGIIVKLLIPKEAKRNNAFGRKCRAEYAQVVEIIGADEAISQHDNSFTYKVGDTVRPTTPFDEDFTNECSTGIHFFITLEEAKNY